MYAPRERSVAALRGPVARRVLGAMRRLQEGPAPFLRALSRGAFDLLPHAVRGWALRRTLLAPRAVCARAAGRAATEQRGLVSVVLPVCDQATLLEEAVASVLAQTWRDLELIVVDDGSRDDVAAVLARFAGDPRLRALRQENRGLAAALSCGFTFARGEFWTWTSADNAMAPAQLERMVAFLRRRPDVAMVYADYVAVDADGGPLRDGAFRPHNRSRRDPARLRLPRTTALLNVVEDNFIGPCFLYRGFVGRVLGDYGRSLGVEDYDYWMRLNALFRIEHLRDDEPLYRYRCHANSISARAAELDICSHCRELLRVEQRRAQYVTARCRVLADLSNAARLRLLLGADEQPTLCRGPEDVAGAVGKTLVWLDAQRLDWLRSTPVADETCVVARFDDTSDVHAHAAVLQRRGTLAITRSTAVAERLRVYTSDAFVVPSDAAALDLARAFAADRLFRALEDPRHAAAFPATLAATGPLRVLLLAGSTGGDAPVQHAAELALGLRALGHEVALFAETVHGATALRLQVAGVALHQPGRTAVAGGAAAAAGSAGSGGSANATVDAVEHWLETNGADVAVDHHDLRHVLSIRAAGVPVVHVLHATDEPPPRLRRRLRAAEPLLAAHVLASPEAAAFADAELGLDLGKAVLVPAAVERAAADRVAPDAREYALLLGWIARGGDPTAVAPALRRLQAASDGAPTRSRPVPAV